MPCSTWSHSSGVHATAAAATAVVVVVVVVVELGRKVGSYAVLVATILICNGAGDCEPTMSRFE